MFATTEWTTLAANDYGDAVGFHDHHRDLTLKVVVGEIENLLPDIDTFNHVEYMPFSPWIWDSSLRGGKGTFKKFERGPHTGFISNTMTRVRMNKFSEPQFMYSFATHSVTQKTRHTAWFVEESGESSGKPTKTWTRRDLTGWHNEADWYQPMTDTEIAKLWRHVKGLA